MWPLSCYIWGAFKRAINRSPDNNLAGLKKAIFSGLAAMLREEMTHVRLRYRSRIETVIAADDDFFE